MHSGVQCIIEGNPRSGKSHLVVLYSLSRMSDADLAMRVFKYCVLYKAHGTPFPIQCAPEMNAEDNCGTVFAAAYDPAGDMYGAYTLSRIDM